MAVKFGVFSEFGGKDKVSGIFKKMSRSAGIFGSKSRSAFGKASKAGNNFKSVMGGTLSAQALTGGLNRLKEGMKSFVTEAQKIEDARAAFTPLMGGVDKAASLVDALNATAASTPFQFDNISASAKQLLPVMNQDIEKTISTFRMLGDTAGGSAQKLDSITRGFTKSMLKGKVDMESMNMIAEAGVPIYSELSKSMGVSVAEMMKMSSAGKISSDDLTKAFQVMTSEGGIFFQGMEIASKTLSGKLSTLADNIALTKAAIGTALLPIIKPMIDKAIEFAGAVREWASANQQFITSGIQNFLIGVKMAYDNLKPGITAFIEALKIAFQVVKSFASEALEPFINLLPSGNGFINGISNALIFLSSAVSKVLTILTPLSKMLNVFFTALFPVKKETESTSDIFTVLSNVIGFAVGVINSFITGITPIMPLLAGLIKIVAIAATGFAAFNLVMSLNPFGLIVIAIGVVITAIGWLINNWDMVVQGFKNGIAAIGNFFKNLITGIGELWNILSGLFMFANPMFVFLVELIKSIATNWGDVVDTFKSGDIIGGILGIGKIILSAILAPVESLLNLLAKVPGLGDLAAGASEKIQGIREGLFAQEEAAKARNLEINRTAPNQASEQRKAEIAESRFQGRLDIAGAPPGSTFTPQGSQPTPFNVNVLGVNP